MAETKTGTVIIDVKSFTEFKDKITVTEKDEETGEEIEVEKDNTPKDEAVKIVVDGKPKTKTAKENSTNTKFEITGKGRLTIEVWVDGEWKKDVDMDLNSTQEITIKK